MAGWRGKLVATPPWDKNPYKSTKKLLKPYESTKKFIKAKIKIKTLLKQS